MVERLLLSGDGLKSRRCTPGSESQCMVMIQPGDAFRSWSISAKLDARLEFQGQKQREDPDLLWISLEHQICFYSITAMGQYEMPH